MQRRRSCDPRHHLRRPPANPCHRDDRHITLPNRGPEHGLRLCPPADALSEPFEERARWTDGGSDPASCASMASLALARSSRRSPWARSIGMMDEFDRVQEAGTIMAAPILDSKDHTEPSAFTPDSLLRKSRRQKGLDATRVPQVCVLDPDGDIVRDLVASGQAHRDRTGRATTPTSRSSTTAKFDRDHRRRRRSVVRGAGRGGVVRVRLRAPAEHHLGGQITPSNPRPTSSSLTVPSATRARATTTCHRRSKCGSGSPAHRAAGASPRRPQIPPPRQPLGRPTPRFARPPG